MSLLHVFDTELLDDLEKHMGFMISHINVFVHMYVYTVMNFFVDKSTVGQLV